VRVLKMNTAEEVQSFMRAQLIRVGLERVVPSYHA